MSEPEPGPRPDPEDVAAGAYRRGFARGHGAGFDEGRLSGARFNQPAHPARDPGLALAVLCCLLVLVVHRIQIDRLQDRLDAHLEQVDGIGPLPSEVT